MSHDTEPPAPTRTPGQRWFPDLGVDVGRVLRHDHVTGVLVDPEEDPECEATWHD